MTFLFLLELFGIYAGLSVLLACAIVAAGIHIAGDNPLMLDGSRLRSVLDDRDRAHMLDVVQAEEAAITAAYLYAERQSMELDSCFALPAVDHPRWGA